MFCFSMVGNSVLIMFSFMSESRWKRLGEIVVGVCAGLPLPHAATARLSILNAVDFCVILQLAQSLVAGMPQLHVAGPTSILDFRD